MKFAHTVLQISECSRECLKDFGSVAGTACDIICLIVRVNDGKLFLTKALLIVHKPGKLCLVRELVICYSKKDRKTHLRDVTWWVKLDSSGDSIKFVAI